MLKRVLRSRRGEGYIDVCVLVICAMLVIALAVKIMPVYIAKQQLDTFATELVREAELYGRVGTETTTDGYYYSGTIQLLKYLLQNPELLELPAGTPVEPELLKRK